MRHIDDLRVGVRRGMMPWGRERLAESAYEAAKKELAKKNPDRHLAIWHLDSATNLNPTFSEAISLKEQLSGKVISEPDGSSIRGFVKDAIMRDVAPATQPSADANDESGTETAIAHPTTLPTASATTQPSDITAEAPSTQPSEEATAEADAKTEEEMAEAPADATTQPAGAVAEYPSTQPAAVADGSSDEESSAAAPATQPTNGKSSVTETPTEEVAPNAGE
jgi:hypothetical protein